MASERPLHVARDRGCPGGARSAILRDIATLRGGVTVNAQPRLIHLKGASELEPKCGATDATSTTNWVRGASFAEVYVPAEVVGRADVVCGKCQEAAISDDTGSDDEVVPDDEEMSVASLEGVSDADLLAEIARRMGNEEVLSQEQRKESKDHRN
jgi:glutaredoxin-related protein